MLLQVIKYFPSACIMDIGGANGKLSRLLSEQQIETILLEPGIEGVMNARRNGLKHIIHASFQAACFKENSLPSIGLFDVLEHIEQDVLFLQSLSRAMKGGSTLYITVPAFMFLWSDFDHGVGHFRRYTTSSLCTKLRASGFEVVYDTYFFSWLPAPMLIVRTLSKLLNGKKVNRETEHLRKRSVLGNMLLAVLKPELVALKHRIKIPFGSSCLVIARKPQNYE